MSWLTTALRSAAATLLAVFGLFTIAPAAPATYGYATSTYVYDAAAPLPSQSAAAPYVRGSSPGLGATSSESLVSAGRCCVAAKSGDEFVVLASAQRRTHILTGDAAGGGHLWSGLPGKTPFPKSWSGD